MSRIRRGEPTSFNAPRLHEPGERSVQVTCRNADFRAELLPGKRAEPVNDGPDERVRVVRIAAHFARVVELRRRGRSVRDARAATGGVHEAALDEVLQHAAHHLFVVTVEPPEDLRA